MKTAIIFDADGVLIQAEPFSAILKREYEIDSQALDHFFTEEFHNYIIGKCDLLDYLDGLLERIGWKGAKESFLRLWFESENEVNQKLLLEVERLRENGYLVCVGTNQEKHRVSYMKDIMEFDKLFDAIFASCELGVQKPNDGFYWKISEEFMDKGIDRIVFFDDRKANVTAAREMGWEAIHFHSVDSFWNWKRTESNKAAEVT